MPYDFPTDLRQLIDAQLAGGPFASDEAVLREALSSLGLRQRGLEALKRQVTEAEADLAAGRVGEFSVEATMARIEQRRGSEASR